MPQDKNAVDSFLGEVQEEKSPFANQEIFTEAPVKEAAVEEVEEDEKPLPFNKDPKVQRYIEKQVKKALENAPKTAVQEFREDLKGDKDINLPESLIEFVGNDTPQKLRVLKDLGQYFGSLKGEAKQEFLQELEQQQDAQRREDTQAQEELDEGFEAIEETFNVDLSSNSPSARKARSEFVDFVRQVAPKNEEGEVVAFPDLVATFEVYQERGQKPSQATSRAKELAARGMQRSGDATQQPKGGSTWKDVDKLFSKLN